MLVRLEPITATTITATTIAVMGCAVPADQVGKKVTIRATVTDMGAKVVAGTNLVGTWTA